MIRQTAADIRKDLRYAARMLIGSPGFAAMAVLTLALGLGANTAIFSVVHAVILKPLPFRDPGRLVSVWDTYQSQLAVGISPPELYMLERQTDLFDETAWYRYVPENLDLTVPGSEALEIHAAVSSPALFSMLGVGPAPGRAFTSRQDPHSVLLSDKLWRRRFAADAAIVGRTIRLNGGTFTVTGIMPPNFQFPDWADVWLPPGPLLSDELTNPVRHAAGFIGRLRKGVTERQAAERVTAVARQLAAANPKTSSGFDMKISTLKDDLTANVRPALFMLLGAVALVLLIACGNVANLLLSRSSARAKEIAIRAAVGADRSRILQQLLTESILLAFVGAAAGLLLAKWALAVWLPSEARLDSAVFIFLAVITAATSLLFGLAPAFELMGSDLASMLRIATVAGGGRRLRGALVVFEFALTLMLVIGAGLLAQSFNRLMHVQPGFNAKGVLTLKLYVPPSRKFDILFHRMEDRMRPLPGVQSMATINVLPLIATRATSMRFNVPGSPFIHPDALPAAQLRAASPDYFRAMQIPLVAGRAFTERDLNQPVVIINETLARRYWPSQDTVGRKFVTGPWGPNPAWSTIIGVAGDVKEFGLDSEPVMDIYFPAYAPGYLILKMNGNPLAIANAVQREIHAIDSEIAISDISSMEEIAAESARSRRWTMGLLAGFAGLALVLAIIGIYGVMSSAVAHRMRELGIRMALGARAGDVRRMLVREGMLLGAAGILIGIAGAFAMRRVSAGLVFGISTADPLTFSCVPLLMLGVTLLACYLPARRASRVDPVQTLRIE